VQIIFSCVQWLHVQIKLNNLGETEISFALSGRVGARDRFRRVTGVVARLDEKMRTCCAHS
jgi:hypothetical protein